VSTVLRKVPSHDSGTLRWRDRSDQGKTQVPSETGQWGGESYRERRSPRDMDGVPMSIQPSIEQYKHWRKLLKAKVRMTGKA
jgi:hypothetical protein